MLRRKPKPLAVDAEELARMKAETGIPAQIGMPKRQPGPLERAASEAMAQTDWDRLVQAKISHELDQKLGLPAGRLFGGAHPTRSAELTDQTTITREALESLVSRVPGLSVDWNNGSPVFKDNGQTLGLNGGDGSWQRVGDVTPRQKATTARVLDKMVRDVLTSDDEAAKAALKQAKGATDADIKAAERLLRGADEGASVKQGMSYRGISLDEIGKSTVDVTRIVAKYVDLPAALQEAPPLNAPDIAKRYNG